MGSIRPSSLRWQLGVQAALLLTGAGLLAVMAVGSLSVARREYGVAAAGYRELTRVYEVGSQVRTARTLASVGNGAGAVRALEGAERRMATMELEGGWQAVAGAIGRARGSGGEISAIDGAVSALSSLATEIQGRITAGERKADDNRRSAIVALVAGALVLAGVAAVVAVMQYRRVVRPLGELGAASRRLAGRDFSLRLADQGPAELAQLAADFNRMAAELESVYRELEAKVEARSKALAESSRLASVGYLAAGVAHEINNPLGIITGYAERAARAGTSPEKVQQALAVITEEAFRCHRITGALLSLAKPGGDEGQKRGDEGQPRSAGKVELGAVVVRVVERLAALPVAQGKEVEVERGTAEVWVAAKEGDVTQVVMNLVINALEAVSQAGGRVAVAAREAGELVVEDNGPGIAVEVKARLFEPFVTTKGAAGEAKNLGLGLMVVRTVTAGAGAEVEAGESGLGGARFVVKWKLA